MSRKTSKEIAEELFVAWYERVEGNETRVEIFAANKLKHAIAQSIRDANKIDWPSEEEARTWYSNNIESMKNMDDVFDETYRWLRERVMMRKK